MLGACGRDRADRGKGMMSGIHRWIEEASLSRYMDRLDANQMREVVGTESEPAGAQANFRRLRANRGDPGRPGRHVEAVLRIHERPAGGPDAVRAVVR